MGNDDLKEDTERVGASNSTIFVIAPILFSGVMYFYYFKFLELPLHDEVRLNFQYLKWLISLGLLLLGIIKLCEKSEYKVINWICATLSFLVSIILGAVIAALLIWYFNFEIRWSML